MAAPTFDAQGNGFATSTSITFSVAPSSSGDTAVLFVYGTAGAGLTVSATYAGAAMTQVDTIDATALGFQIWAFVKGNVPSGSSNVVMTPSTSTLLFGYCATYSGADINANAHQTFSGTSNGTTFNASITTTVNDCILVGTGDKTNSAEAVASPGTNRYTDGAITNSGNGDSPAATAGSNTMNWAAPQNNNFPYAGIIVALQPPQASAVNSGFFFAASR